MGLNSRAFTVDGKTYTAGIENGQVQDIILIDGGTDVNNVSINPGSNLFKELSEHDTVLEALSIDTTGQTGNVTETSLADNEILDKNHQNNVASENNKNKDIDETTDDTGGAVATDAGNGNPVVSVETLRYPYDIDIEQDHLKITQYTYKRHEGELTDKLADKGVSNGLKYQRSVQKSRPTDSMHGEYQGGVILPMPKVSDSNGAEWGKSDLNVFELGATALGANLLDVANDPFANFRGNLFGNQNQKSFDKMDAAGQGDALRGNIQSSMKDLDKDVLGKLGSMGQAGMGIAATQLGKLAGLDISADEFLARSTGSILNPNAELLFQGPVLRDFGFKFLMIARSEAEAKMIRSIIRFFKIGSAPVYNGGPSLLGTPNIFQLEYKAGSKTLNTVNKFNEMALRTITVDYAPDGFWSAYQDSHPVAIVLNLQFSELKPIYQTNHNNEPVDSVGY